MVNTRIRFLKNYPAVFYLVYLKAMRKCILKQKKQINYDSNKVLIYPKRSTSLIIHEHQMNRMNKKG